LSTNERRGMRSLKRRPECCSRTAQHKHTAATTELTHGVTLDSEPRASRQPNLVTQPATREPEYTSCELRLGKKTERRPTNAALRGGLHYGP
jgi:hypothetical protein